MAVYEYEHDGEACDLGKDFEHSQPISDDALTACPACGRPVHRLISRAYVSTPRTNTDLKSMGFAKLEKRDKGVYENVTALNKESRYWDASKPETMPDIKSRITD